jgi:hypothetical protein
MDIKGPYFKYSEILYKLISKAVDKNKNKLL